MHSQLHYRDAYAVYLFAAAARIFLLEFGFSVSGVYQIVNVGMTPLQLVLVGTLLATTVLLFEIPTGIVADVYSRRLSVIIGLIIAGMGFIVVGLSPTFVAVLFGNFLWGLANTFISGAFTAWFVDEVGQQRAEQGFMRRTQIEQVARVLGLVLGAMIGSFVITLPMILAGIGLVVLGLLLFVIMPETGFTPATREQYGTWATMRHTFGIGFASVRSHPILRALMLISILWGIASVAFYRLWEKHLLDSFTLPPLPVPYPAVIWFSVLALLTGILTVVVSEWVRKRINNLEDHNIALLLAIITLIFMLGLIGFGAAPGLLVTIAFFLITFTMGDMTTPILDVWTNRYAHPTVRATVLSMYGQTGAIGRIVGGPIIGAIGNTSMWFAMIISAVLFSPALIVYGLIAHRKSQGST